jgi:hypothetical protein
MLAINTQLTAEQRLSKNITAIMGNPKYVALAGVLMIGEKGIKDDIPTACTDGRTTTMDERLSMDWQTQSSAFLSCTRHTTSYSSISLRGSTCTRTTRS